VTNFKSRIDEESQHPSLSTADYESIIEEYIFVKENKAEIPLSLETRMRFERPKHDGEFITV
jgi:hypothetical protein